MVGFGKADRKPPSAAMTTGEGQGEGGVRSGDKDADGKALSTDAKGKLVALLGAVAVVVNLTSSDVVAVVALRC